MFYVGMSGWVYDQWRGRFYPTELPQRAWLEHYATQFATVEINNSFYRLPKEETFREWHRRVPKGFVFAVKASRYITHIKRLKEPEEPLGLFWSRARTLGETLGPVLFQLPPRFHVDLPLLRAFLAALPVGIRAAFEFRDRSWEIDAVFAALDDAGAAFVYADRPGARIPDVVTGGWAYVRFHQGSPQSPFYDRRKLARWADRLTALHTRDVFVYFNNDEQAAAIHDGTTFCDLLADRGAATARPTGPADRE